MGKVVAAWDVGNDGDYLVEDEGSEVAERREDEEDHMQHRGGCSLYIRLDFLFCSAFLQDSSWIGKGENERDKREEAQRSGGKRQYSHSSDYGS